MLNGRISMNKKLLTISCISSLSLTMYTGCSDSTSAADFYNAGEEIDASSSSASDNQTTPTLDSSDSNISSSSELPPDDSTPGSSANVPASSSEASPASSNSNGTSSATIAYSSTPAAQSSSSAQPEQVNENPGDRPVIAYAASGATVTNAGNCVTVTGGTVTIKCGGEYDFSGSYSGSDAQILVNTAKTDSSVYLNMKGLTLTNTADAPIYIQKASKAFVVAKNGTTNTFTDASSRAKTYSYTNDAGEAKTDTTGACIYSKDDLTIKGEGTLIVKANYNNGIHTSNDLKVKNGIITVNAKNNGLKGKGSVEISGGTINITTTEGDGIKSDTEDATDLASGKGSIEITGGTITVTSAFDGITAANAVVVANGESEKPTIKIITGGGHSCLSDPTTASSSTGRGGFGGGGFPGGMGGSSCSTTESMKGIKGDSSIAISGGVIDINSRDDGLHSGGTITLSGGTMTIATDDDGVHAEKALYVKDNANVSVTIAYEGMESPDMNFEGGITSVITTDDGWNAAGGTSTTTGNNGGNTGRGGPGGFGGGGFGGMGGLMYIIPVATHYSQTVGGYGYLALSVLIFGQWRCIPLFGAAAFFAFCKTIANAYAGIPILANLGLPSAFFKSLPFMITLVALAITSKHDRAPKASGQPYDKSMR